MSAGKRAVVLLVASAGLAAACQVNVPPSPTTSNRIVSVTPVPQETDQKRLTDFLELARPLMEGSEAIVRNIVEEGFSADTILILRGQAAVARVWLRDNPPAECYERVYRAFQKHLLALDETAILVRAGEIIEAMHDLREMLRSTDFAKAMSGTSCSQRVS